MAEEEYLVVVPQLRQLADPAAEAMHILLILAGQVLLGREKMAEMGWGTLTGPEEEAAAPEQLAPMAMLKLVGRGGWEFKVLFPTQQPIIQGAAEAVHGVEELKVQVVWEAAALAVSSILMKQQQEQLIPAAEEVVPFIIVLVVPEAPA